VSVAGTLSSAVGGSIVGLAYYVIILLCGREAMMGFSTPPQWPLLIVTTLAGLLGSLIDSLLGATLQYSGQYWLLSAILDFGCNYPHIQTRFQFLRKSQKTTMQFHIHIQLPNIFHKA